MSNAYQAISLTLIGKNDSENEISLINVEMFSLLGKF